MVCGLPPRGHFSSRLPLRSFCIRLLRKRRLRRGIPTPSRRTTASTVKSIFIYLPFPLQRLVFYHLDGARERHGVHACHQCKR